MDTLLTVIALLVIIMLSILGSKKTGKRYSYWYRGASGERAETYFDRVMDFMRCIMFILMVLSWIVVILYILYKIIIRS